MNEFDGIDVSCAQFIIYWKKRTKTKANSQYYLTIDYILSEEGKYQKLMRIVGRFASIAVDALHSKYIPARICGKGMVVARVLMCTYMWICGRYYRRQRSIDTHKISDELTDIVGFSQSLSKCDFIYRH